MGKKFAGQMDTEKAEAVEQRAYRFEGFPSQEQAHLLSQFIGSARFLWNRMLADWKDSYRETGQSVPVRTPVKLANIVDSGLRTTPLSASSTGII